MYGRHGEVMQSGLIFDENDDKRVMHPCVGVIWQVYASDDPSNPYSLEWDNLRGHTACAEVIIVDDGSKNVWSVPNALLPAPGPTGWQDFAEWLPKGCTLAVDGGDWRDVAITDYSTLDGTWCVLHFVGGRTTCPVVLGYINHPRNRTDPATSGMVDDDYDQQGRMAVRWNGTTVVWTPEGDLYFDTNGANAEVKGSSGDAVSRTGRDEGGDVQLDMKAVRALEVNFNTPPMRPGVPSLFQLNPPDPAERAAIEAAEAAINAAQSVTRIAAQAADTARSTVLNAAAATVAPLVAAAQSAVNTAAAAAAVRSAAVLAEQMHLVAQAALGDLSAISTLAARAKSALDPKRVAAIAERVAIQLEDAAIESAAIAATAAQELAAQATAAAQNALAPRTAANIDEDRLESGVFTRGKTRVRMSQNEVYLLAGRIARILSRGGDDSVIIGGTPEAPPAFHAALAEPMRASWDANTNTLNEAIDALNEARIALSLTPYTGTAKKFPANGASTVVKVK